MARSSSSDGGADVAALPTSGPVRVAVLNDHELVVEGLAGMLRRFPDRVRIEEVGTDAKPGQAVDLVLYDMYGAGVADRHWSEFLGRGWAPRYVVQYDWKGQPGADDHLPAEDDAVRTIAVPKWLGGEALVAALEEIHATGTYSGPTTTVEATQRAEAEPTPVERLWPGKREGLTERESEVVALIVEGMSNKEIAASLYLGVNTIKTYVRSAYRTMGVADRSNAVLWGIDHGFRLDRPAR
ncbi:DNA-binding response regulator [Marmoricola endophyticus]|uniref:DNA-binding response regulator n=1 Tax=Marmoricola endophyticus TaxID=2040280 RepID=A0A917F3L2_9ACTN|nr:response regulator transcription factor [Marmoricola endophyticus]GGF49816.1 DNA-binding response regulator [Marmoricola endophyticus]